jgi:hypothetical protein
MNADPVGTKNSIVMFCAYVRFILHVYPKKYILNKFKKIKENVVTLLPPSSRSKVPVKGDGYLPEASPSWAEAPPFGWKGRHIGQKHRHHGSGFWSGSRRSV